MFTHLIPAAPTVAAALGTISASVLAQTPSEERVKALVAAQVTADYSMLSASAIDRVAPHDIKLEQVSMGIPSVRVWRATMWTATHRHPYLLGSAGGEVWRLGGFPDPQLRTIPPQFVTDSLTEGSAQGLGRLLAALADPNGAAELVYPADGSTQQSDRRVVRNWRSRMPATWPADTVIALNSETFMVRITVLSKATWLPASPWYPTAYQFHFASDGELVAWAKREEASFSILVSR